MSFNVAAIRHRLRAAPPPPLPPPLPAPPAIREPLPDPWRHPLRATPPVVLPLHALALARRLLNRCPVPGNDSRWILQREDAYFAAHPDWPFATLSHAAHMDFYQLSPV